jgi:hypothetical protein
MHWTVKDIEAGTPISKRRSEINPYFKVPAIIVRLPFDVPGMGWGICELSDGLIIGLNGGKFGTKEDLAKQLTEMGYFQVPKMIFNGSIGTLPENRLSTPLLIMTNAKD